MSSNLLEKYDYHTNAYTPIPGTEDWVEVARLGDNGGYEWTTFNAFYSPSARRYFWHGGSGCSCSGWTDDLSTAADLENGNRAALLRAWEVFAREHEYSIRIADYLSGVSEIHAFRKAS